MIEKLLSNLKKPKKLENELPDDFIVEVYLELHPDVKAAGVDPAKHYLEFGIKEQRPYRLVSNNGTIGIAAIFKNEKPYIIEWIAAHIAVGVDKFFIADNNSTDGTSELLAELAEKGIINYISFPGVEGEGPQLPAYRKIMELYGNDVDWMAFIDADEFLIPSDIPFNLKFSLENVFKNKKVGAVAINWSIYGSSNLEVYENKPVLKRFTKRAAIDFMANHHYKTIVRTAAYVNTHGNPHLFIIKPEFDFVHTNGEIVIDSIKRGKGLSEVVIWDLLKLNHYVVKSRAEFEKKSKNGSATKIGRVKGDSYFTAHDQNICDEKISDDLFKLIQAKINDLEKSLSIKTRRNLYVFQNIKPERRPKIKLFEANLGNKIFQYFFAYKLKHYCKNLIIDGPGIPELGIAASHSIDAGSSVIKIDNGHIFNLKALSYLFKTHLIDVIEFRGFAMRMENLQGNSFNMFFKNLDAPQNKYFNDDHLVINITLGDIANGLHPDYMPLPIAYYKWLVKNTGLKPVFMGQLDNGIYCKKLREVFVEGIFLESKSVEEDFKLLRSAKNVAISISSSAWIASWTSLDCQNIYMPLCGLFNTNQRPDIDLVPYDDKRYHFIRFPIIKWTACKEQFENFIFEDNDSYEFFMPDTRKLNSEKNTAMVPTMPSICHDFFEGCLIKSSCYLEFGSGYSTYQALRLKVDKIFTVESDWQWLVGLIQKIHLNPKVNFKPLYIDIGETKELGYPKDTNMFANYWKYSITPWLEARRLKISPDLVLIDGRFRVACFLASLVYAKKGTTILFDDYTDRNFYHCVEQFIKPTELVDRMAVFVIRENDYQIHDVLPVLAMHLTDPR